MATNRQLVKEIIAEVLLLQPDDIKEDVPLDNLGVSSIDLIDICLKVEEGYKIDLPDGLFGYIEKPNDLIEYLDRSLG